MKFHVAVTSRASQQLAEAAIWWSEHRSTDQALRWLEGFEAAIAALSDTAEQHGLARENDLCDLSYPVRQLLYGIGSKPTHRALYEIRNDTVYVVAIRHLAQNDLTAKDL